ncbi:MAG: SpoIIE family protein phosphatase [Pontiellaceae bacterium]|nr:SpoIIE family protein phosphatase [Pontiellaceae bacterium]
MVRRVLRMYLERAEYRVIEAEDGEEGLAAFERESPDLVMLDLRMPKVDGLEVLAAISTQSPDTPVIVLSGAGILDDAIQALRLGAWDYQLKPITNSEMLYHTIRKNLERSRLIIENNEIKKGLEEKLMRIQEDSAAAMRIQNQMLPPPKIQYGPYCMQRRLLPSMLLSGDFIDYFELGPNHLAFYAADVSGHGVSSALVTVMLKSFMNAYRDQISKGEQAFDPAAVMSELNPMLLREKLGKHVTMFFGIINTHESTLSYCSCGHFPYPILHHDGQAELIDQSKNLPLGMIDSAVYQSVQIQLPHRFRLNIFSDGALDLLEHTTLEEKLNHLMTLYSDQSILQLLENAKAIEELPDDISILSIDKEADHE